ncbi:MAG: tRNA A-37 threonylcarbamoyl transferase component Bud32, partial [bacterium]
MPSAIGRYVVLRTIARGGMSVVYEVEDPQTRERFALKHLSVDGEVARNRFAREYAAMVRLIHPNIGRVFAQGEHDDYPWMTLEYLDGVPVTEHVEAYGAPGSRRRTYAAVQTMLALAHALDHVHARRVVHRDIKSGNVLVLPDGRVKLVDFGIAWVPGSNQESEHEEFVGTLAYAAPEQFRGKTPTAASDLYSVGCLLYRLLTGNRPFTGSNAAEMAKLHTSRPPTRPRSIVPELPGDLERIVLRLMKKKPDARIPTARALAEQLAEWMGTQPKQTVSIKLDRGSLRGIGREKELETIRQEIDKGVGGTVITLRGLLGARHNALVELLVGDAQARQAPVFRITHKDSERFAQLHQAGQAEERTLVALVDVHQWDSGSSRALERSIEAAADNPSGAIYVASIALDTSDLAIDLLLEQSSCDVVLQPLPLDGTRRLVGALLQRHAPPSASARSIHHATDGVPAYIEEVIGQMIAKGQLDDVRDGNTTVAWPWRQQSEVPTPEGAAWTVDQAFAAVDALGQRILEALAATHAPASVDRLLELIDLEPPDRNSTLLRLVTTGLVRLDIHNGEQRLS